MVISAIFTKKVTTLMRITYIDGLEKEVQCTSVTRRSAGIPMLVRSIVSSEKRGSSGGRHLLSTAVKRLLGGNRVNFVFFFEGGLKLMG